MEIFIGIIIILFILFILGSKKEKEILTDVEKKIMKTELESDLKIEKDVLKIIQEIMDIDKVKKQKSILDGYLSLETDTKTKIYNTTEILKLLPNLKNKPNLQIDTKASLKLLEKLIAQKIELSF